MMRKLVVAVTGCTGTGKTKLGIELAKKFNGEVISADSMQLYRGLDIITNTTTKEETQGIPHHCISYVSPSEKYTVTKYIEHTMPIIHDILRRGMLPIIVGGTAYYIEALLWNFTLPAPTERKQEIPENTLTLLSSTSLTKHEILEQIDPISASCIHPNNARKIERSLEVFEQNGITQSELLKDQHKEANNDDLRGTLRWDGAVIFSITCNQDVLDVRLDDRVDEMLHSGLVQELKVFDGSYEEMRNESHEASGLLSQVIGYKEFQQYLLHMSAYREGNDDGRDEVWRERERQRCLSVGIDAMKQKTRRYSRKQLKWIEQRLLNQNYQNCVVHTLDCTDLTQWNDEVLGKSIEIVETFLSGDLEPTGTFVKPAPKSRELYQCEMCKLYCQGSEQFEVHLSSRKHHKMLAGVRRREKQEQSRKLVEDTG